MFPFLPNRGDYIEVGFLMFWVITQVTSRQDLQDENGSSSSIIKKLINGQDRGHGGALEHSEVFQQTRCR